MYIAPPTHRLEVQDADEALPQEELHSLRAEHEGQEGAKGRRGCPVPAEETVEGRRELRYACGGRVWKGGPRLLGMRIFL